MCVYRIWGGFCILFGILLINSLQIDIGVESGTIIGIIVGILFYFISVAVFKGFSSSERYQAPLSPGEIESKILPSSTVEQRMKAGESEAEAERSISLEKAIYIGLGEILGMRTLMNHPNAYNLRVRYEQNSIFVNIYIDKYKLFDDKGTEAQSIFIRDSESIIPGLLLKLNTILEKYKIKSHKNIELVINTNSPGSSNPTITKRFTRKSFNEFIVSEKAAIERMRKSGQEFMEMLVNTSTEEESKEKKKEFSENILKKCPFCAEMIKAEAIVCRYCGRDLPK